MVNTLSQKYLQRVIPAACPREGGEGGNPQMVRNANLRKHDRNMGNLRDTANTLLTKSLNFVIPNGCEESWTWPGNKIPRFLGMTFVELLS